MDNLYEIFMEHIIDKQNINERKTVASDRCEEIEQELLETLSEEQKRIFKMFKDILIEHMLLIREEDCEKILVVALKFANLVNTKMEEIQNKKRAEDIKSIVEALEECENKKKD